MTSPREAVAPHSASDVQIPAGKFVEQSAVGAGLPGAQIFYSRKKRILFVRLTRKQALRLASGLVEQVLTNDCNWSRAEFIIDGMDFSVAAIPEGPL